MPKLAIQAGSTSQTVDIFIQDSTATDGSGKTGLVYNSAITAYYNFPGGSSTAITLATLTNPNSAWSSGGFKEIDATNQKGHYRFDIPNALLAAGNGRSVKIVFQGTGIVPCPLEIELTGWDNQKTFVNNIAIRSGTAQSGSNANSIKLDSGASSTTDFYKGCPVVITGGTGVGQVRVIIGYNGSSKVATIDRAFSTAPDNTSTFAILPSEGPSLNTNLQVSTNASQTTIRSGTAQAGSSTTITLDSGASSTDNIYNSDLVVITSGTGAGQSRTITAYVGSTKVATVSPSWITSPDNTSVFNILASTNPSQFSDQGVAQAATSTTITLQSTASSVNSIYNGSFITILSGTGSGQTKTITGYVGSTKVATVDSSWSVTPDTTSSYAIIPASTDVSSTDPNILAIKAQTDKLLFDSSNNLKATLVGVTMTFTSGFATNQNDAFNQIYNHFFGKTIKDRVGLTIKSYDPTSLSTVLTTQTYTDDGIGGQQLNKAT